ncbi:MAG: leucine-rich repeat protein [Halobacteriovoraceae bacterium]|nr:leucine-rich repeat protein [Halobacteriovoraceae bacterium]
MKKLSILFIFISMIWSSFTWAQVDYCKRHPAVVKELEDKLKIKCSKMTHDNVLRIGTLEIWRNHNKTPFKSSDFTGLEHITYLTIASMNLYAEPGALKELKNLKGLKFSYLQNEIPSVIFEGLEHLEMLILHENDNMTKFGESFLEGLDNLRYLHIRARVENYGNYPFKALRFSYNLLENTPKLEEIYIKGRGLRYIPNGFFDYTPNLKSIGFYGDLIKVEENLFKNLTELEKVYFIRYGALESPDLPDNIFENNHKVSYLNISWNYFWNLDRVLAPIRLTIDKVNICSTRYTHQQIETLQVEFPQVEFYKESCEIF